MKFLKRFMCLLLSFCIMFFSFPIAAVSAATDQDFLLGGWHFINCTPDSVNVRNIYDIILNNDTIDSNYFIFTRRWTTSYEQICMLDFSKLSSYYDPLQNITYYTNYNTNMFVPFYAIQYTNGSAYSSSFDSLNYSDYFSYEIPSPSDFIVFIKIDNNISVGSAGYISVRYSNYSTNLLFLKNGDYEGAYSNCPSSVSYTSLCSVYRIPDTKTDVPVDDTGVKIPFSDLDFYAKTLGVDKAGFTEWLFSTSYKNKIIDVVPSVTDSKISFIVDYFDKYGGSAFQFIFHSSDFFKQINVSSFTADTVTALHNILKDLYSEYQNYLNVKPTDIVKRIQSLLPSDDTLVERTIDNDLVVVDSSDSDVVKVLKNILNGEFYIMSIINNNSERIINAIKSIDLNFSFDAGTSYLKAILDAIKDLSRDFKLFIGVSDTDVQPTIKVKIDGNDSDDKPSSEPSSGNDNKDISDTLEYLFKPTFSDFDDLEQEFKNKFPILQQLDIYDPDDYLLENNRQQIQSASIAAVDDSYDYDQPPLPSFEEEAVYENDELFSFEIPENSNVFSGAFNGVSFSLVSFSKFKIAIEAFKGIVSVLAVAAFSKWLLRFAPKLMYGYGSGD